MGFNNASLAKKLLQSCVLARLHLCVSGGGASIPNSGFSLNEFHAKDLDQHIQDMSSQTPLAPTPANLKKQYKARIQCYASAIYLLACGGGGDSYWHSTVLG